MSSILVYGGNKKDREDRINGLLSELNIKISDSNPDLLYIKTLEKKKSIGIDQVRGLIKFINEKPFASSKKATVISRGDLLTVPAQNSLLKILEEHPDYAYIILGAKTENDLLETIISRCKKVSVRQSGKGGQSFEGSKTFQEVRSMPVGERLAFVEAIHKEEKDDLLDMLEGWVDELRKDLNRTGVGNIEEITKVRENLENSNVNVRLSLEYLQMQIK